MGPHAGIRTERRADTSIVTVSGQIDLATAPSLRAGLMEETGPDGGRIVVDLLDVSFMDSSGLSALLAAREAAGPGRPLVLVVGEGPVERLITMTALDELFEVVPTVEAALA